MSDQQTKIDVAKALGLKFRVEHGRVFTMTMNTHGIEREFNPATNPAAALWAINKYCDDNGLAWAMFRNKPKVVGVAIAQSMHQLEARNARPFCKDECTAICDAIIAAAKGARDEDEGPVSETPGFSLKRVRGDLDRYIEKHHPGETARRKEPR